MADDIAPATPQVPAAPPNAQEAVPTAALTAKQWLEEIRQGEKDYSTWSERAKKVERRYLDQRNEAERLDRQYAMLYANISVLQPAVYARTPAPVVSRRFSDRDPVGRAVSEVVERSLISIFDTSDIDDCMRAVRDDFLVVSRGTAWVRYEPKFETQEIEIESGTETYEALKDETVCFDFVHWTDFIHPKARRWEELPWVGRRVYPDRQAMEARFGKEKTDTVFNHLSNPSTASDVASSSRGKDKDKPCIYEIWSKRDRTIFWIAKDYGDDFMDVRPPLYDLHGFFPCPKPAYGTMPTDDLKPIPDYIYYQDQATEVNKLTARIGALQDALKLVGFYPAGAEGGISTAIETALQPGTDNRMVPVPAWTAFVQGGGAKQMIEWLPVEMVVSVLQGCITLRKQLIDDIYQITGISDILRGQGQASETATAQSLKAQWGGIRIRDRQAEIARFARDLTRIAAEIIAEKFQPETLWRLSGLSFPTAEQKAQVQAQVQQMSQMGAQQQPGQQPGQPPAPTQQPQVPQEYLDVLNSPTQEDILQLLRDDQLRSYRIDIETDSTIAADEAEEKKSRVEFVTTIGGMLAQAIPVAQQVPELVPVIGESLLFVSRAFRAGRQLEDVIEQAVQNIEEKARSTMAMPPPPSPDMVKVENDLKLSQAKLEAESQHRMVDAALRQKELDAKTADSQTRAQIDTQKLAIEERRLALDHASAAFDQQRVNREFAQRDADRQAQKDQQMLAAGFPADYSFQDDKAMNAQQFQALVERMDKNDAALAQMVQSVNQGQMAIAAALQGMASVQAAPKRVIRDQNGTPVGVETMVN